MSEENQEILVKFGKLVRQIRIEKNLTLLEVEVRTGINEGALSKIENGKKNLAFTTLVKLANGLEIPLSKLFAKFKN